MKFSRKKEKGEFLVSKRFHPLAYDRIHFIQAIKLLNPQNPQKIKPFEAKVWQAIVIAIGNIVCNFHQRPFYLSIAGAKYLQHAIVLSKVE